MCQLLQKHAVPRPIPFRSSPQLRHDNQGDEDMEEVQSVHSSSEDSDMEVQSVHSSRSQFSEDSDVEDQPIQSSSRLSDSDIEEDPHVQTSTQAPPSSQLSDLDMEDQQVKFDRASHLQDETDHDEDQPVQSSSQLSDLDMEDQPVLSSDRVLQLSIETDQPVQSEMGAQLQNGGLYENEHRDTPLTDEEDLIHQSPDNAQPLQGANNVQSPDNAPPLQDEEDLLDQPVCYSPGMKIE